MRLSVPARARHEPTIALINIVFLMLVFFLVAGQIARPADRDVRLVEAGSASARAPDDALVLRADGAMLWRGAPTLLDAFSAAEANGAPDAPLRILPDANLSAGDLIAAAAALRAASGRDIRLVTERSLAR